MRLGIADHFGWAVAVTAAPDGRVVDRRRIELVEPGVPVAPIHTDGKHLDDAGAAAMVAQVRASIARAGAAAFDELAASVAQPIESISLRSLPDNFPEDIEVQRRTPYEARADAIMYRQELVELGRARGWKVRFYDAKTVEAQASELLGARVHDVLHGPRATLGPPWTKDHRVALAATIIGG
jgi:hypothetical protein